MVLIEHIVMRTLGTVHFLLIVILFCSPFHFSKNGNRHNSSLTSLYCSHKSTQADIKPPPQEKAIIEFDSGRRAGEAFGLWRRKGGEGRRSTVGVMRGQGVWDPKDC